MIFALLTLKIADEDYVRMTRGVLKLHRVSSSGKCEKPAAHLDVFNTTEHASESAPDTCASLTTAKVMNSANDISRTGIHVPPLSPPPPSSVADTDDGTQAESHTSYRK